MRKFSSTALLVAMLATCGVTAHATVTDALDTTNNFFSSFGGTTATGNGDGTVTLTRTVASQDAGIDWRNGGLDLSLSTENLLTITPVSQVNGGYWNVHILFFNNGTYLDEKEWISDTNVTTPQTLDVAAFATAQGVSGANEYFVRFRIQPWDQTGVGFKYTEISAVPEPATVVLVLGALPLTFLLRRRTR